MIRVMSKEFTFSACKYYDIDGYCLLSGQCCSEVSKDVCESVLTKIDEVVDCLESLSDSRRMDFFRVVFGKYLFLKNNL